VVVSREHRPPLRRVADVHSVTRRPRGTGARLPRRRDRHGRGLRGRIAPPAVPLSRTRAETFDELVLDAVEQLEQRWAAELAGLEFAVEEVPPVEPGDTFDNDTVLDRGVPLARLFRGGLPELHRPVVVVYRRPIEARAADGDDRGDLVFMVVVDLAAEFLGKDPDDLDPPR